MCGKRKINQIFVYHFRNSLTLDSNLYLFAIFVTLLSGGYAAVKKFWFDFHKHSTFCSKRCLGDTAIFGAPNFCNFSVKIELIQINWRIARPSKRSYSMIRNEQFLLPLQQRCQIASAMFLLLFITYSRHCWTDASRVKNSRVKDLCGASGPYAKTFDCYFSFHSSKVKFKHTSFSLRHVLSTRLS